MQHTSALGTEYRARKRTAPSGEGYHPSVSSPYAHGHKPEQENSGYKKYLSPLWTSLITFHFSQDTDSNCAGKRARHVSRPLPLTIGVEAAEQGSRGRADAEDPFVPLGGWNGSKVEMRDGREETAGDVRTSVREAGRGNVDGECIHEVTKLQFPAPHPPRSSTRGV